MDYNTLNFTIFCISNVARALGIGQRETYHLLHRAGIIDGYIVPCYDTLHTFSREYVVDDLIDLMKKKGALA